MIRINLLPTRKKKKKPKPVPGFFVAAVLLVVLAVILTFFVNFLMKGKLSSLASQKKGNEEKIAKLQEKIKEVKSFEELNKKFTERKQIIEELRKNQSSPVKILDELSKRLTDGIWFQEISISASGIELSGVGFTNEDVVTFVQNLKASDLLTDIYLHETVQAQTEGVPVYKFKITMGIRT
jgi:type IV pilus assembly protein PilN